MALNLPYKSDLESSGDLKAGPKPKRGEYALDQKATDRERKKKEQAAMQAALVRDGKKCRYPRCAYRSLKVDPCHETHRGMGGNPAGDRTKRESVIALCRRHHQEWDEGDIRIVPEFIDRGFDDICTFGRRNENGVYLVVATEKSIGVSETRT